MDIGHQLQGPEAGLKDAAAEIHDVVGGAVVHHVQQQLFGENVDLQALQGAAGGDGMNGQVGHPAGIIHLHILGEAGRALQTGGADHGHIGAAVQMLLEYLSHRQVDRHIAPGQDHIVLTDVLQIVGHAGQGIHVAPVLAAPLRIAKGGEDPQAAVLAGQVPVLAGTHMVQQRLIALVDDNAHVGDTGVDIVGQHKVDQAVAAAERQRAGVAGAGQLAQIGVRAAREHDPVKVVHTCSPPFTFFRTMALGLTTAFSPTLMPPATTAIPQSGSSEGGAPTVASASMTAPSATMA